MEFNFLIYNVLNKALSLIIYRRKLIILKYILKICLKHLENRFK